MPALLIASLAGVPAVEIINWNFIAAFSIGIAITWVVTGLAGRFFFKDDLAGSSMRGVIASYGNNGYLGIPLAVTAFGAPAMVPASHSVLINSVFIMTGAVLILEFTRARETGSAVFNIAKVFFTNPLLLARPPRPQRWSLSVSFSPGDRWLACLLPRRFPAWLNRRCFRSSSGC